MVGRLPTTRIPLRTAERSPPIGRGGFMEGAGDPGPGRIIVDLRTADSPTSRRRTKDIKMAASGRTCPGWTSLRFLRCPPHEPPAWRGQAPRPRRTTRVAMRFTSPKKQGWQFPAHPHQLRDTPDRLPWWWTGDPHPRRPTQAVLRTGHLWEVPSPFPTAPVGAESP